MITITTGNISMSFKETYTSDLECFVPIEATYSVNELSDRLNQYDIASRISDELSNKTGFPVKVQLFRRDGRAISDNVPSDGAFIANRSWTFSKASSIS